MRASALDRGCLKRAVLAGYPCGSNSTAGLGQRFHGCSRGQRRECPGHPRKGSPGERRERQLALDVVEPLARNGNYFCKML